MTFRVLLSAPSVGRHEHDYVGKALASGWIAPLGPDVDAFEREIALQAGRKYAVALSSGTAALHLSLLGVGVKPNDEVLCSTFTFAATANAVMYVGARPTFIDSESASWNLDPTLLEAVLAERAARDALPAAVLSVDLYGQCANYTRIAAICERYSVPLIEDAAEALGAAWAGRPAGSFGQASCFSFNGNKMITCSGGGMLVTDSETLASRVRYLATQAREPLPHYEHKEVGYNYRLSNVLAALGRAQLAGLPGRVSHRRSLGDRYRAGLETLRGVSFMPEPPESKSARWLTVIRLNASRRARVGSALAALGIETRRAWKPMHMQPVFVHCPAVLSGVAEGVFAEGLCLPSGPLVTLSHVDEICATIRGVLVE